MCSPDEDLLPVVRELLQDETMVLSLVAILARTVVGHIAFTMCSVDGGTDTVALLAPLAVAPERQRQGIGSALIGEGLRRLKIDGAKQVCVLGDPAYYGRHGFRSDDGVKPPYPLAHEWREAWQAIRLRDGEPRLRGVLSVPRPWRRPALWAP